MDLFFSVTSQTQDYIRPISMWLFSCLMFMGVFLSWLLPCCKIRDDITYVYFPFHGGSSETLMCCTLGKHRSMFVEILSLRILAYLSISFFRREILRRSYYICTLCHCCLECKTCSARFGLCIIAALIFLP